MIISAKEKERKKWNEMKEEEKDKLPINKILK